MRNQYEISERRACQAMQMNRSSYRYVGQQALVNATHQEVIRLSDRYPYFGYRKIYDLMRGSWSISSACPMINFLTTVALTNEIAASTRITRTPPRMVTSGKRSTLR